MPPELKSDNPEPTSREPGAQLDIRPTSEVDIDGDLAGDRTEDRTDLAVSASAVRGPNGRLTITVTNHGPRTADWPYSTIDRPQVRGWTPACVTPVTPRSDKAAVATLRLSVRHRKASRRTTRTAALRANAARSLRLRLARVHGELPTGRAQLTVTIKSLGSEERTLRRRVRLVR